MRSVSIFSILTLLAMHTATLVYAADTGGSALSVRSPQPGSVISPEIDGDRRVTFRLKAPQAREVQVTVQKLPKAPMTRNDEGVWSATVGPVAPGVWEYSFVVDGLQMVDPGNSQVKPQRSPRTSILHIRGSSAEPWDFVAENPHGTMHQHIYQSKALGKQRRFNVYTPPGYENSGRKRYPVLYLVHGFSDNDAAWSVHGKANWILDNLIAQGRVVPMIVVMPDGHPLDPETTPRESYGKANMEAFASELTQDIIPGVERTYRTAKERQARALAGLSMGGGHTLYTGFKNLDRFAWLGAFSAGVPGDEQLKNLIESPDVKKQPLRLLWVACGKDDFLLERNRKLDTLLTSSGLSHTWILSEGDHSWPVWRNYLTQFTPLLFRK